MLSNLIIKHLPAALGGINGLIPIQDMTMEGKTETGLVVSLRQFAGATESWQQTKCYYMYKCRSIKN